MAKKFGIAMVIIVIAGTVWFAYKKSIPVQEDPSHPIVKTTLSEKASNETFLGVSGFVRGENRADISPMASGKITRIFKHEGDIVKKGDVLATIEATQTDAQIAAASANVKALEKTLDASGEYYDQLVDEAKSMPDSKTQDESVKSAKRGRDLQIQNTKDQLIAAKGALAISRAGKNNFILTAPFAGTITTLYGREGGFAHFSSPLMSVNTHDNFEIETYVSATDARTISVGSIATFKTVDNAPVSGIVTAIAPGSDASNFKTLVRIHIDSAADMIRLGDFLHGNITVPRAYEAVTIPRGAIVSRGGDPIVFVLNENDTANAKSVTIRAEHDGLADIAEGIGAGERIVTEGQQYLINGSMTTPYETK